MFKRFSILALTFLTAFCLLLPKVAHADATTVVTLGKDLTPSERQMVLQEMGVNEGDARIIEITNDEEHKYLGKYLSQAVIGTHAISSAKITLVEPGKGISVKTKNITSITPAMYANAAITAGVKDADIYVTAPYKVSGTAALTGIIKAFETATGKQISEEQKQVANEEIVKTQQLADEIKDPNKAAQFMVRLKEEIAKEQPKTPQEFRDIVINVSNEFNINLSQSTINQLVQFSQNFSKLDINWDQISSQLQNLRGDLGKILNVDNAKGILDKIFNFLGDIFNAIGNFFKSLLK